MSKKQRWRNYILASLIALLTFLILKGHSKCDISNNNDRGIEDIGCWKNTAQYDRLLEYENLISFDLSGILNKRSCGNRITNIVEECAQLTRNLGYSVFFINFELKQPCLTGSHAPYIYTSFDSALKLDCTNGSNVEKRTYVYSLIGTLSDIFTNDEAPASSPVINTNLGIAEPHTGIPPTLKNLYRQNAGKITLAENTQQQSIAKLNGLESPISRSNFGNQPITVGTEDQETQGVSNANTKIPFNNIKPQGFVPLSQSLSSKSFVSEYGMDVDERIIHGEHPTMQSDNILRNPSFEIPLVENSLTGWICQGKSRNTMKGFLIQEFSDYPSGGKFSGKCTKRKTNWVGPGQYIGRFLKPETSYRFSCLVRLVADNFENINNKEYVQIWLQYEDRNAMSQSKKVHNKLLARIQQPINDVSWEEIFADFHVPVFPNRVKYAFISVNGPKRNVDIMLDTCKLSALPKSDDEWIRETDAAIDKNRKRTVKMRLIVPTSRYNPSDLFATKIQIKQKRSLFAFGAAIYHRSLQIEKYRKFFLDNFEWSVLENEMKWPHTEEHKGFHSDKNADEMVEFLLKNNKKIRGHCIFWASEECNPSWLQNMTAGELREAMEKRLHHVVTRYKGMVHHWDVNNEMLHGKYYKNRLGDPSIPQWMFHKAKELDRGAKMFLNDLDVVANSMLTKAYVNQAKELLEQNTPIEGLGAQGHFTGIVDPATLKDRLDLLTTTNLSIWLTEVDIVERDPHKRAKSLENIMRVSFSHPGVHGIILWCFWNQQCWRGRSTGLVDGEDFKLTEAGRVYQDLRKKWTTNVEVNPHEVTGNEGLFSFRGFHGDYDMYIYLPDGQTIIKNFTLTPSDADLQLKVHVFEHSKK